MLVAFGCVSKGSCGRGGARRLQPGCGFSGFEALGYLLVGVLPVVCEHLQAPQRVIPRPPHLAAHVDADRAVADGPHVELRALHVGFELLRKEVAQLLHCEPLHVEGPQPRQVHGTVGPDREGAAEFRDVEQLHLQAVARAEDVGVVHNAAALQCTGARGPGRQRLRGLHGGRCSKQQGCSNATDCIGAPQTDLESVTNLWPADAGPPLLWTAPVLAAVAMVGGYVDLVQKAFSLCLLPLKIRGLVLRIGCRMCDIASVVGGARALLAPWHRGRRSMPTPARICGMSVECLGCFAST